MTIHRLISNEQKLQMGKKILNVRNIKFCGNNDYFSISFFFKNQISNRLYQSVTDNKLKSLLN